MTSEIKTVVELFSPLDFFSFPVRFFVMIDSDSLKWPDCVNNDWTIFSFFLFEGRDSIYDKDRVIPTSVPEELTYFIAPIIFAIISIVSSLGIVSILFETDCIKPEVIDATRLYSSSFNALEIDLSFVYQKAWFL